MSATNATVTTACLAGQGDGGSWSPLAEEHPPLWKHVCRHEQASIDACAPNDAAQRRDRTGGIYRYEPAAASCKLLRRIDVGALCSRLAGWRVFFVGDSVQQSFFLSFVMLLSPTRANSSGMCVPHSFLPQRVCADHVHGGVLLTAVRDDWLTLPSEQRISPADLRGNRGRVTQRNKGAWFTAFNHAHEGKRTLLVLSDSARVWPLHMRNAHLLQVAEAVTPRTEARRAGAVVWRTAVPGHPNCQSAKGPLPSLADSSAERHLATLDMHYNWHLINETRAQREHIFRRASAAVLDAYSPGTLRPDEHPRLSLRMDSGFGMRDCLHYCKRSDTLHTWSLTLATMIQVWGLLK